MQTETLTDGFALAEKCEVELMNIILVVGLPLTTIMVRRILLREQNWLYSARRYQETTRVGPGYPGFLHFCDGFSVSLHFDRGFTARVRWVS